jgi:hypothetical protein
MSNSANRCEFGAWTVEHLVNRYTGKDLPRFALPSFQRDFVWKPEKQKKFVDSVRRNFPVGCILLFAPPDGRDVRYIVDGLQRCTTLAKYSSLRFKEFADDDIPQAAFQAVAASLFPGLEQRKPDDRQHAEATLRRSIVSFMRSRASFDSADGYDPYQLFLQKIQGKLFGSYAVNSAYAGKIPVTIGALLDTIRRELTIDDRRIPVVEFFGEQEHLPDIFELLNTQGTKLSKYDVLAAQWNDTYTTFRQREIAKQVQSRYADLVRLGLDYDGNRQSELWTHDRPFLLYEFMVGLGRLLKERFPALYGSLKKQSTEVDSISFNLSTLVAALRINQLNELQSWLRKSFPTPASQPIDVTEFAELLIDASAHVQEWLSPTLDSRLLTGKLKRFHSEYQIAAIVATVARCMMGDSQPFGRIAAENRLNELSESVPQRYWFEGLALEWKGSGDSRAYSRVTERTYLRGVPYQQFEERLTAWHEQMAAASQKAFDSVTAGLVALVVSSIGLGGLVDSGTKIEPTYDLTTNKFVLGNVRLMQGGEDLLVRVGAPGVDPNKPQLEYVRQRFGWFSSRIADALYQAGEREMVS